MNSLIDKYNIPGPRYTSYPTVPFWDDASFTSDPCTATNPRESDPKIVEMIYTSAYYGKDID